MVITKLHLSTSPLKTDGVIADVPSYAYVWGSDPQCLIFCLKPSYKKNY